MTLIAFIGYKGSGKSEAARTLIEQHGFVRHSFADPLKRMLLSIGLTEGQLWGSEKEVPSELLGGKTPRHAMQALGETWGRQAIDKEIWIRIWEKTIPSGNVVVDDLRYPNEAELVRNRGGTIVRILRPDVQVDTSHPSEQHVESIEADYVVVNDHGVVELRGQISDIYKRRRTGLEWTPWDRTHADAEEWSCWDVTDWWFATVSQEPEDGDQWQWHAALSPPSSLEWNLPDLAAVTAMAPSKAEAMERARGWCERMAAQSPPRGWEKQHAVDCTKEGGCSYRCPQQIYKRMGVWVGT